MLKSAACTFVSAELIKPLLTMAAANEEVMELYTLIQSNCPLHTIAFM